FAARSERARRLLLDHRSAATQRRTPRRFPGAVRVAPACVQRPAPGRPQRAGAGVAPPKRASRATPARAGRGTPGPGCRTEGAVMRLVAGRRAVAATTPPAPPSASERFTAALRAQSLPLLCLAAAVLLWCVGFAC